MKINVKQLSGEQFFVEIEGTDTIAKLKSRIEDSSNIPVLQQRLIFGGKELIDTNLVNYYNIFDGKTVHLVMRRNAGPSMYGDNSNSTGADIENQLGQDAVANNNNAGLNNNDEATPLNGNNNNNNGNDINNNNNGDFNEEDGARLMDVLELSRACRLIRLFAIIDCVLMVLFAFWGDLLFLAGVPLAICGYYGAKNLKRGALFIYAIFILLSVTFRIYLSYMYPTWLMILLTVISVLLELYVFRQVVKLFLMIPRLSENDQRLLQSMSDMFV